MNLIFKLKKVSFFSKHLYLNSNTKYTLFSSPQIKFFSKYNRKFDSTKSGEANRSQRGIFQGKMDRWGFMKSHSMRHTRRRYKVNVKRKMLYSQILQTKFFPWLSTTAIRTIRKYGSFDRYLLHFKIKFLRQSQFAMFMRSLIKKKLNDPNLIIPKRLPLSFKGKDRRIRKPLHELKGIPSIYIPVEASIQDFSGMSFNDPQTRWDRDKTNRLLKELENVVDTDRRNEILKELDLEKEDRKLKEEMLTLMPIRHKHIRDCLVRIKNDPKAKLHLLESLENSENFTKAVLGDQYKHYSVDYPEVQLILQITEDEKKRSTLKKQNMLFKDVPEFKMGESYEGKPNDYIFNPYKKNSGKVIRLSKTEKDFNERENWEYTKLRNVERKIYHKKKKNDKKKHRRSLENKDIVEVKTYKV